MKEGIAKNLQEVYQEIAEACERVGRNKDEVQLLLATKTVTIEKLEMAMSLGAVLFGENKAQELRGKYPLMAQYRQVEWQFIGHLQTNKVKDVVKHVTLIHSVDRLKLGKAIQDQLVKEDRTMDILVQVNTSYEESKFGAAPETAVELVEQLTAFDRLKIKGLMTIGKLGATNEETRDCFRLLRSIQSQIKEKNIPGVEMEIMSMGMSGDFQVAIEEGATMVRVGTRIFGERYLPDSYYWNEEMRSTDTV